MNSAFESTFFIVTFALRARDNFGNAHGADCLLKTCDIIRILHGVAGNSKKNIARCDVADGNIFFLLPATPCSIRFITWPTSCFVDLLICLRFKFYLFRFMLSTRAFAFGDWLT